VKRFASLRDFHWAGRTEGRTQRAKLQVGERPHGIVVVGCMVCWICMGEFCCPEEFIDLAADSPQYHLPELRGRRRQTQTFLDRIIKIFRIIFLLCQLQHEAGRKQSACG